MPSLSSPEILAIFFLLSIWGQSVTAGRRVRIWSASGDAEGDISVIEQLTVQDFLERAAQVYPDRVALVDEPDVAGSMGVVSYESLY